MVRAIDLFCGIGGNSWGAREAGVEIVAGFDKWDLAGRVFQDNFPEARFYLVDLATLSRSDIQCFREELGPIDLILASPECTSHSVARGASPKNRASLRLSWNVWRFAEIFRPRWIVVENVPAFRSWRYYADFLRVFHEKGEYHYRELSLTASDFGVPQKRKRLYLLFDRKRKPHSVEPRCVSPPPVANIISLNGEYSFTPLVTERRARNTLARAERAFAVLGRETPFLMVYYSSDKAGGWQSLDAPLRTVTTRDRFALVKPDGNGGHLMRMLQPPELQKAMGFPAHFRLEHGTRRDKIHMLGNAVCPPVIKAIVETLLEDEG